MGKNIELQIWNFLKKEDNKTNNPGKERLHNLRRKNVGNELHYLFTCKYLKVFGIK